MESKERGDLKRGGLTSRQGATQGPKKHNTIQPSRSENLNWGLVCDL